MNQDPIVQARGRRRAWLLLPLVAALVAVGLVPRLQAESQARRVSDENALPTVRVVHPVVPDGRATVTLPATLQAGAEAAIRARSSGYVASWQADIGTPVKAGQTLATLVAPELADTLRQAQGDQDAAQAASDIAEQNARRWQEMLRTNATSRQEAQQKDADAQAARARLAAAKANAARLRQQLAYTRITAPFDGVITARNVDVGTLVDAAAATELFHEAQASTLRAVMAVPDAHAGDVHAGLPVEVTVAGQTVKTVLKRSAGALDPASRMLRAEADVANPDGHWLPGQYASVTLKLTAAPEGSVLPIEAVVYRPEGPMIAVVGPDGRVGFWPVRVVRDLGTEVVVSPALKATLQVVANPGDALTSGDRVRLPAPPVKLLGAGPQASGSGA